MLTKKTEKFLNLNYFVNVGLHLGCKVQNRAVWLQGFILGSRSNSWEILNIQELLKSLEKLGPIVVHIIKNGGTILVLNRVLEKEMLFLSKIFKLNPFSNVIRVFTDEWIDGAFTNFINFKFLNLRQLPSLVFLSDFTNSNNLLDEAYFLRIPVVGLVDSRLHHDLIMKKVMLPVPSNNSIKSLFYFFNFLKYYIEKGLHLSSYSVLKDDLFKYFNNFENLNKRSFLKNGLNKIYQNYNKRKFFYLFDDYIKYISNIEKNAELDNNDNKKSKPIFENLDNLKYRHLNMKPLIKLNSEAVYNRGHIQRFKGVLKHTSLQLEEKYSIDKHFFTRYNTPVNWKRIWLRNKQRRMWRYSRLTKQKKSPLWNIIYNKYKHA